MDEEKQWEQPQNLENANGNIEENLKEEVATCPEDAGSQFGKFKDAKSLLDAYNNLQAEFTRKCQKLSQTIKEQKANNDLSKDEQDENQPIQDDALQQTENHSDCKACSEENLTFMGSDWNEKVYNFLKENTLANDFKSEISQEILQDKSLQQNQNCLDLAWARVVSKNFKPVKTILNDDEFVDKEILSNEKIKQKIIEEYVENLNKNKPPKTINSSSGIGSFYSPKTANNMSEAKIMVQKIFNVKGE